MQNITPLQDNIAISLCVSRRSVLHAFEQINCMSSGSSTPPSLAYSPSPRTTGTNFDLIRSDCISSSCVCFAPRRGPSHWGETRVILWNSNILSEARLSEAGIGQYCQSSDCVHNLDKNIEVISQVAIALQNCSGKMKR